MDIEELSDEDTQLSYCLPTEEFFILKQSYVTAQVEKLIVILPFGLQTRGWFYTLLVLGTALFDKPPFKNLIVNGLVLAAYVTATISI